jgi:hypothetical protein
VLRAVCAFLPAAVLFGCEAASGEPGEELTSLAPVAFSDSELDDEDWRIAAVDASGDATHAVQRDVAGSGNPGPYRRMTHTVPYSIPPPPLAAEGGGEVVGSIEVQHRYVGASQGGESSDGIYDPGVLGAIVRVDVSFDRRLIDGSPGGVADAILAFQGGVAYRALPGIVSESQWTTVAVELDASDFDANGAHPDFSAQGAPLSFGYARSSGAFGEQVHGIDTWSVTVQRSLACQNPTASFHVAQGAVGGSGTLLDPFGTVREALDRGEELNLCTVFVVVGEGTYEEDLAITRDTYIAGTDFRRVTLVGTIENRTGSILSVEGVTLDGQDGPAILVEHPSASTILAGVVIGGATGYGLKQVGGSLQMGGSDYFSSFVEVGGVGRSAPDAPDGVGIHLRDVEAKIENTLVYLCDVQALVLAGPASETDAADFHAFRIGEGVVPSTGPANLGELVDGVAAIEVSHGAHLAATRVVVIECSNIGVWLHDSARAEFIDLTIDSTRNTLPGSSDPSFPGSPLYPQFGLGLVVRDAAVTLDDFIIGNSGLAGIVLFSAASVPLATRGLVHHNPIGLSLSGPFDDGQYEQIFAVFRGVRFVSNDINLDSLVLPLPPVPSEYDIFPP